MKFIKFVLFSLSMFVFSGCVGPVIGWVLSPLNGSIKADNFSYCYGDQILVVNRCDFPVVIYASGYNGAPDQVVWTLSGANDPIGSHHIIVPAPWLFNGRNVLFTAIGGQRATAYTYHSSNQVYNAGYDTQYQSYQWSIDPRDMR